MRILCVFIMVCSLGGCTTISSKNADYKIIASWSQKEFILPDSLIFYYFDRDSTEKQFCKNLNSIKIIAFINGSCPDCILELNKWYSFIEETKNYNLKYLFVVYYFDFMQFKSYLSEVHFEEPFILDKKNHIFEINNFPEEKKFHCVLLDRQNKIILIGNPILSQSLKELYLEQIGLHSLNAANDIP